MVVERAEERLLHLESEDKMLPDAAGFDGDQGATAMDVDAAFKIANAIQAIGNFGKGGKGKGYGKGYGDHHRHKWAFVVQALRQRRR